MKTSFLLSSLASISLLLASNAFADHQAHYSKHNKHHKHHGYTEVVRPQVAYVRQDRPSYRQAEYARVTYAQPIYRSVAVEVPVESCRVESVAYNSRSGGDSFKGTVVGGLVGAALGHELGNGRGNATAAGGLLGAAIGNNVAGGKRVTRYEDRQVCSTAYRTEYQRELVAYDVSYNYLGRAYRTETRTHPGDRIAVDLAVIRR